MSDSNNDPASDPDEPKVSASAIVCEFTIYKLPFGKGRMILDPEAGVIYFKKCFVPYGFLTRKVRGWYACKLSDIQRILLTPPPRSKYEAFEYTITHREWGMCIDSVHGKVEYIECIMNDEIWRVGKYLEEYIRCQEKESPLSQLKTKSAELLVIDETDGIFGSVKAWFLMLMCMYGLFFSIILSTEKSDVTNKVDDSGLSLTVFGLLGGITGWLVGSLICNFLLILLPEKITKSRTRFGCILLLLAVWPVWIYLPYLALCVAIEAYVMLISPLIVTPEDQVFWFSVIGVAGLIVALGCGFLIRSIFRYRRAVTESLQASELSGLENQQPDKKPEELLADISSSATENPSGEWSEKE